MKRPPTPAELKFLIDHNIPVRSVFDLMGGSAASFHDQMRDEGCLFGYNATSCTAGKDHTLVSRTSHCIQCDTSRIAYIRRHSEKGDVYLVASLSKELVKIGSTAEGIASRLISLNAQAYGGASDWEKLLVARDVGCCGEVESKIHRKLAKFNVVGICYEKDGVKQECYELFRCSVSTAAEAFNSAIPQSIKVASVLPSVFAKYKFRDRS